MYKIDKLSFNLNKRLILRAVIPICFAMLLSSSYLPYFTANGQVEAADCFAPLTTMLGPTYQGPVVVDAYWVDQGTATTNVSNNNPVKKEIGPGEGPATLAIVFNNRGSLPILSIVGFLNLPSGYEPTGESQNPQLLQQYNQASRAAHQPATASFYGTVDAGAAFTLYFNLKVLPTAKIGTFPTTVIANYYQQGEVAQQCTSALLNVPFVLPGKVVLDAVPVNTELAPQNRDNITITIENKGSADATGVIATIVNLGSSKGATGGSSNGGSITLSSTTTQLVNLGPSTFNLGKISAGSSAKISTTIYPSSTASGSTQEVQLQISYQNAWGALMTTGVNTGLVIAPNPPQSLNLSYLGNTTTPLITAGNLDDLNFAVANNSTDSMSNIVISLVPQSTSVSIVGASTWTIPNMTPGERQILATKVFAANSLINTPTSFTLTANYVSKSQTQSNSLTLGTFVVGDIKLQLYSLTATTGGSSQGLTGNLLNQGSTTGLFTTVDLAPSKLLNAIRQARIVNMTNGTGEGQSSFQTAQADQSQGGGQGGGQGFGGGQGGGQRTGGGQRNTQTQQFLGDLTPDSPIPFSIPVRGLNLIQPGMYPVSFKVVYADDLKTFHTVILNGTVMIPRTQQLNSNQGSTSIFDQIPLPMVMGVGIAIAAGVALLIKRRRSSKRKLQMLTQGSSDIVSILDSADKKENES